MTDDPLLALRDELARRHGHGARVTVVVRAGRLPGGAVVYIVGLHARFPVAVPSIDPDGHRRGLAPFSRHRGRASDRSPGVARLRAGCVARRAGEREADTAGPTV